MSTDIYLHEIFTGFQGEGLFAGQYQLFIRLKYCNLNCYYCDTKEAFEEGDFTLFIGDTEEKLANPIDKESFYRILNKFSNISWMYNVISVTGGEPLLQGHIVKWIKDYYSLEPKKILLETNGTLSEKLSDIINYVDIISMDFKLTEKKLEDNTEFKNFLENTKKFLDISAKKRVYIKIPVTKEITPFVFSESLSYISSFYPKISVFLQPVFDDKLTYKEVLNFYSITANYFENVKYLPQIHKLLGFK